MSLRYSGNVYVSESYIENAGLGVFARRQFLPGQIIEVCPVIEIPSNDPVFDSDHSELGRYVYSFGEGLGIALGYGSFYNHSYDPNATYVKFPSKKIIEIVAINSIPPGIEVTVNYNNGDPNDQSPLPEVFGIK